MIRKISALCCSLFFLGLSFISCSEDEDVIAVEVTVSTSDFTTTIDENPSFGEVIGTVQGRTNAGVVTFSIIQQNPSDAFFIDSATGQLTVANAAVYDFESITSITGIVKVSNGEVSKNASITININNLPEPKIFIGDVTLATQEEVNVFGAENYTRITGSLIIGTEQTQFSVVSLAPLINLTSVRGVVIVSLNQNLPNLEGLNNLVTIESEAGQGTATERSIFSGNMLNSMEALSSLRTVNKSLWISGKNLENINGLSNLEYVGTRLIVTNTKITNLDPLMNLTHVSQINLYENKHLTNLDGLSNINSPLDDISIQYNTLLDDFCGIRHVFLEYGEIDITAYVVFKNAYNPSQQAIIDGNCSL